MMEIIITAKTLEEAQEKAILELGSTEFEIEVIEMPKKGILGFGTTLGKYKMTYDEKPDHNIEKYLEKILESIGAVNYKINIESDEHSIAILIKSEELDEILKSNIEFVDSVQLILALSVNKLCGKHYKVTFNINDYKEKNVARLESLAVRMAVQVSKTHKKVTLNPMNAYQRRIIHAKLQDFKNISTYSIGEEPNRKIVIASQTPAFSQPKSNNNSNYKKPNNSGFKPNNTPKPFNGDSTTPKPFNGEKINNISKPNNNNYKKPYNNNNKPYNNQNKTVNNNANTTAKTQENTQNNNETVRLMTEFGEKKNETK